MLAMNFRKLSIIIPSYNEKDTIEELIRRVKAVDLPLEKEIIVVDDGSNDGTREIIKTIPGIRYIFHEKNLGKGGAVKTGFKNDDKIDLLFMLLIFHFENSHYIYITPVFKAKNKIKISYPKK